VAGGELLDLAVVERQAGGFAILDEDLGELTTSPECCAEDALENVGLDQPRGCAGEGDTRGCSPLVSLVSLVSLVAQRRMFPRIPPTAPAPMASAVPPSFPRNG
jgi:hypothetical protein